MMEEVIKRRIELGMSQRSLADKAGMLPETLRDAERRNTLRHFTVEQLFRLDNVLELNLTNGLRDAGAHRENAEMQSAEDLLSDEELLHLLEIFSEELDTGSWSEAANASVPAETTRALVKAGVLVPRNGKIWIDRQVAESLRVIPRYTDESVGRVTNVSEEFCETLDRSLHAGRARGNS